MKYKEARKQASQGAFTLPHFADKATPCDCKFLFSEDQSYMGSVADFCVDNGKRICEGGNDGPPLKEAQANAALIVHEHNHFPRLLEALEGLIKELPSEKTAFRLWAEKRLTEAGEVKGL